MSSIKVSALTAKTTPAGTEELLINDSGVSKKITIANLPDTNTTYSVGDGGLTEINFTSADNSKLDAIEAGATADQTAGEIEAIVTHDNLLGFVANEHIDWTTDQGATNIHAGNYTDTNTTYSVGDGGLSEINFTSADNTKLDGIATGATANGTVTGSGTTSGTNTGDNTVCTSGTATTAATLATARTINGVSFNGSANITVADSTKLPLAGGALTGAVTTTSTFDGRDVSVDGTKLDGIASGAEANAANTAITTADQSWTGSQRGTTVVDNDGSFDMNGGNNFKCTPTGAITLTFTNITNGQSGFILLVNSGQTVSAHANTKVDANLLATVTAAGTYLVSYFSDGTNVYLTNSAVYA